MLKGKRQERETIFMTSQIRHVLHAAHVQHHFSTADQQYESSRLGMWLFLVTEILLFGGLFVAYGILRSMHPEAFLEAHKHLDKVMGTVNTLVLICSSLTMALAVRCAQTDQRKPLILYLVLTLALAAVFLAIKYFEYSHKIHDGLLPGRYFTHAGGPAHSALFFGLYFLMTGLHGLHILAGMSVIGWVLARAMRGDFSSAYYTPVDLAGLYWHLVDLVWIYLFPLLYLVG